MLSCVNVFHFHSKRYDRFLISHLFANEKTTIFRFQNLLMVSPEIITRGHEKLSKLLKFTCCMGQNKNSNLNTEILVPVPFS